MCFEEDDEYSNGRLITTIVKIYGVRRDKYVQLDFFVHERMNLIRLLNVFKADGKYSNGWLIEPSFKCLGLEGISTSNLNFFD